MTDAIIAEGRAAAIAYNGPDGPGFKNEGRINVYICEGRKHATPPHPGCRSSMVTIDREPGVTPFITRCDTCGGEAVSMGYRVPARLVPTHEWYRPETVDANSNLNTIEHLRKGGLLLRAIEQRHD